MPCIAGAAMIMTMSNRDTIAAIATAPGTGGVGIVRLSGPDALSIGSRIAGRCLQPRHAHHAVFRAADGEPVDDGIALYFAAPASYTGEDVVELQGHGGRAVLAALLARCRSEEHTSELQSRENLVCRLLLEKKKQDGSPVLHATRT